MDLLVRTFNWTWFDKFKLPLVSNLKKGPFPDSFSFFRLFYFNVQLVDEVCRYWDLNRWSLGSEATTLPTEPPPLPSRLQSLVRCKLLLTEWQKMTKIVLHPFWLKCSRGHSSNLLPQIGPFSGPGRAGKKRWLGKIPDLGPKGQLVDSFSDILGSVSPIFFSPARSGFKTARSTFEFF